MELKSKGKLLKGSAKCDLVLSSFAHLATESSSVGFGEFFKMHFSSFFLFSKQKRSVLRVEEHTNIADGYRRQCASELYKSSLN